jgi:hypothetical protein
MLEETMLTIVAALTAHATRQLTELGALLGLLGGLALGAAAVKRYRQWGLLAAAVLFVLCFLLLIYGLHFGLNPYRLVK